MDKLPLSFPNHLLSAPFGDGGSSLGLHLPFTISIVAIPTCVSPQMMEGVGLPGASLLLPAPYSSLKQSSPPRGGLAQTYPMNHHLLYTQPGIHHSLNVCNLLPFSISSRLPLLRVAREGFFFFLLSTSLLFHLLHRIRSKHKTGRPLFDQSFPLSDCCTPILPCSLVSDAQTAPPHFLGFLRALPPFDSLAWKSFSPRSLMHVL